MFLKAAAVVASSMFVAVASGQSARAEYPEKDIRLIVTFSPGGGTDIMARRIAAKMKETLGKNIIVENIGGASGNTGMRAIANAAPDGYTFGLAINQTLTMNPSLFKSLPFDPIKSYEPISLLAESPLLLIVNPTLGVNTVQEFIDYLKKKKPGEVTYATPGVGSNAHLFTELFAKMTGTEMRQVPYKGLGDSYPDIMMNRVQMVIATRSSTKEWTDTDKLKLLGVSTAKRSPMLPNVPAVAETVAGYETPTWYAFVAPAGTPKAIIDKLNSAAVAAIKSPEMKAMLEGDLITVVGSTPEEMKAMLPGEIKRWAEIIKDVGIKPQD